MRAQCYLFTSTREAVKFDCTKKWNCILLAWMKTCGTQNKLNHLCRIITSYEVIVMFGNVEVPFRYVFVQMQKELS